MLQSAKLYAQTIGVLERVVFFFFEIFVELACVCDHNIIIRVHSIPFAPRVYNPYEIRWSRL